MTLKFYCEEQDIYADLFKRELTQEGTTKIFNKLRRHFKLNAKRWPSQSLPLQIRFIARKRNGIFYSQRFLIVVGKKPSLGIIVHECAHALEYVKYGSTKHHNRLKRLQARIAKYVRQKNYFEKPTTIRPQLKFTPPLIITINEGE